MSGRRTPGGEAVRVAAEPEALWRDLVRRAAREAGEGTWSAAIPPLASGSPDDHRPRLAGTVLRVERRAARRWVATLVDAVRHGAGARVGAAETLDVLALLQAGVTLTGVEALARAAGADVRALATLAELAALPLLQAAGRQLASMVPPTWWEGYCPVCGAWPTLAEARGVDRARRLRCGRCGGDWEIDWLRCPFCGMRDHVRLGSLVPERGGERRRVETCGGCRGYLKVLSTLTATPVAEVLLEDLATVDLDLAALAEGYVRPGGLGHAPAATVVERPGLGRRLFGRDR